MTGQQKDNFTGLVGNPAAIKSLRLPVPFDEATHKKALDIHTFLKQAKTPPATLDAKLAAHRKAALSHLLTLRGKQTFSPPFPEHHWPSGLYIPKSANPFDYFIAVAPDDHRYAQEWTTSAADEASLEDGSLYCFGRLDNEVPSNSQISESGVGIFHRPAFNLGLIDVQPHVDCSGTVRTALEFFPLLAAGYVEVVAQLLIAAWMLTPSGQVMIGFEPLDVATLRRDQSSGPEQDNFQSSFHGPNLSASFLAACRT